MSELADTRRGGAAVHRRVVPREGPGGVGDLVRGERRKDRGGQGAGRHGLGEVDVDDAEPGKGPHDVGDLLGLDGLQHVRVHDAEREGAHELGLAHVDLGVGPGRVRRLVGAEAAADVRHPAMPRHVQATAYSYRGGGGGWHKALVSVPGVGGLAQGLGGWLC